jgi:hypothetical protein
LRFSRLYIHPKIGLMPAGRARIDPKWASSRNGKNREDTP